MIPRVHRAPKDGVGGLPIVGPGGHVGLADDDGPRRASARDDAGVGLGDVILQVGVAGGGAPPRHLDPILHRHGQAQERRILAARAAGVGLGGQAAGLLVVADDHGVERRVVPRDAPQVQL